MRLAVAALRLAAFIGRRLATRARNSFTFKYKPIVITQ
jgi:hypothetical protein